MSLSPRDVDLVRQAARVLQLNSNPDGSSASPCVLLGVYPDSDSRLAEEAIEAFLEECEQLNLVIRTSVPGLKGTTTLRALAQSAGDREILSITGLEKVLPDCICELDRRFFEKQKSRIVLWMPESTLRVLEASAKDFRRRGVKETYELGDLGRGRRLEAELIQAVVPIVLARDHREATIARLLRSRRHGGEDVLLVLRQWNSFTPILSHRSPTPRGGGYFLRWRGVGIVIDPGRDFVHNLYDQGLGIRDIDFVVITHDHPDHTQDFDSIEDLLFQTSKQSRSGPHEIGYLLNLSTMARFGQTLRARGGSPWVEVLTPGKQVRLGARGARNDIVLEVSPAFHRELGGSRHSVGLVLHLTDETGHTLKVSFTGDTGFDSCLRDFHSGSDVVVLHIGSVRRDELMRGVRYEQHLGLLGCLELGESVAAGPAAEGNVPRLIVISEFGEELLGSRRDIALALARELVHYTAHSMPPTVLSADVGTAVRLDPRAGSFLQCGKKLAGSGKRCPQEANRTAQRSQRIEYFCERHAPEEAEPFPAA